MQIKRYNSLLKDLLISENSDDHIEKIVKNMSKEISFDSLGIFTKIPNMELFRFNFGHNISQSFSTNTIFTHADPLIQDLMNFEMIDMKYPGQYMFEREYSHLLISPLHYQKQLMGFIFADKEEGYYSEIELDEFNTYASLIIMFMQLSNQQKELLQHKDMYEYFRVFNKNAFMQQAEIVFAMMNRYNRYLSLIIFEIGNIKKILRSQGEMKLEKMIESICDRLQDNLRSSDIVGKMSNHCVAILLPETSGKNSIITVNRIKDKLNDIAGIDHCKIGWGINSRNESSKSFDDIFTHAKEAAKQSYKKKKSEIVLI